MTLAGYTNIKGYNGEFLDDGIKAFAADNLKAVLSPLLEIKAWDKTPSWATVSTGTTDGTTTDKLVDSGATFVTDGVEVGMVVFNSTDTTFAIVDAVDSETQLSLRADVQAGSAVSDIFVSGEVYTVYLQFELSDAWFECNGQTISDASSPWDGKTLPDLNATQRFLRGSVSSSTTGGADTHTLTEAEMPAHTHTEEGVQSSGSFAGAGTNKVGQAARVSGSTGGGGSHNNLPAFYETVMIIRLK